MAISFERHAETGEELKNHYSSMLSSYYNRFSGVNGDVAVVDFTARQYKGLGPDVNPFFLGSTWGATNVGVRYTLRPDFDKNIDAHWQDHPNRPAITDYQGALEGGQIAALRFAFSGAGMVEMWTPTQIEVV